MSAIFFLGGLAFIGFAMLSIIAVVGLVIKLAVRLVLLPLLLIKWIVMGVILLIVGPILLLVLAIPLLPLLALAAIVWLLVRATRPAMA